MNKMSIFFIFFFLSTSVLAKTMTYTCPEKVVTDQTIKNAPTDWSVMQDSATGEQIFENLTIYDGNPNERASLVPDNEDDQNAPSYWTFQKKQRPWLGCSYRSTAAMLIKAIDPKSKKCTVLKSPTNNVLQCQ